MRKRFAVAFRFDDRRFGRLCRKHRERNFHSFRYLDFGNDYYDKHGRGQKQ